MSKSHNARLIRYTHNASQENLARDEKNRALAQIICRGVHNNSVEEIDLVLAEINDGQVQHLLVGIRALIARQSTIVKK